MRIRLSWLAAAVLLSGIFVVLPEEGSATTRRTESLSMNFSKLSITYLQAEDKRPSTPIQVADIHFGTPVAQSGLLGSGLPSLPTSSNLEVFATDALGEAHAGSQDVFYTGAPASFPPVSSYHLSMDFTKPGTMLRGSSGVISVQHDPASPGTPDKSYWQASVDIATQGTPDYSFTFFVEANPDQPGLSLRSVQTAQTPNFSPIASSFFDIFVELNYDGVTPIDPAKPVIWLTTTATPEPASLSMLAALGVLMGRRRRQAILSKERHWLPCGRTTQRRANSV